jgi:hypothetical protein
LKVDDSFIEVEGSVETGNTYTIKMYVIYLVDGKEMRSNVIAVRHDF